MTGIGIITQSAAGAVTAPTTEPFDLPTVEAVRVSSHALCHAATAQFGKAEGGMAVTGPIWVDGISPMRHYAASVLGTGLLAPSTAPTATPSGSKAACRLDLDQGGAYAVVDGDYLSLVGVADYVYFKTTLSASPLFPEVLFSGSTPAAKMASATANLKKFINQTGVEGVDYNSAGVDYSTYMTATTDTGTDLSLFANSYGAGPNAWACVWRGGAGPQFEKEPAAPGTATSTFADGAAGSGTDPQPGTYKWAYAFVREDDGAVSGLSPTVEASFAEAMNVSLAAMTASADASVDYNRWYRTTAGGARFYRGNEVAAATTTDTDNVSDTTLTNYGAVAYDERRYRSYRAGMPPKGRYIAVYRGRFFTGGALLSATYQSGTAAVNNNSATVTLTGGYPRNTWVGRTFQVNSVSETYLIMSVSESAGTFVLDRPYEGANNASASYTVKDLRDPYEVFWSETGLPNQWPVQNSLKGVTSQDGKGITGLYAAFESLIIFTRQSVWRLTGYDNNSFALQRVTDKAGCVSGHTVVMDGARMYWLGPDGIYGWAGEGEPQNLSSPPAEGGVVRGIDATMARLNLAHAHRAVARYDEQDGILNFYVPLDSDYENRYAIILDLQTGAFSLDTVEDVTFATRAQGATGDDVAYVGDTLGCVWQDGVSTSDGAYGYEPVQSVSSSTVRTVTVSGTPFPTSGDAQKGVVVWHIGSDGTLTRNRVYSNTSSVLTYTRYMTAPTAATQFVAGAIPLWLQTGRFDLGNRRKRKIINSATVAYSPDSDGDFWFFYAYGQNDFAVPTKGWTVGDLTSTKQRREFLVKKDDLLHGWGLMALEPGCTPTFTGVTLEVLADKGWDL